MKRANLFALWGLLYIICAGLGFIPEPEGAARVILTIISLLFFLPPALLLWKNEPGTKKIIRNLSLISLVLTSAALALSIRSTLWSEAAGNLCQAMLALVSVPMLCSNYWIVSLFAWAVLLMVSVKRTKDR